MMSRQNKKGTSKTRVNSDNAEQIADVLKAVAHPLRLRIIDLLCQANERVSDMAQKMDTRQALVSQQLRILRMSGLVETYREGGISRYALAEPRMNDLITCVTSCKRK